MKNYQFVFGLLFSSALSCPALAGAGGPHPDSTAPDVSKPAPATSAMLPVAGTTPVSDIRSDQLVHRVNLPATFNYAGNGPNPGQVMLAETKMTAHAAVAEDVSEPASEILLLAGLSALAIAVRRQSNS